MKYLEQEMETRAVYTVASLMVAAAKTAPNFKSWKKFQSHE